MKPEKLFNHLKEKQQEYKTAIETAKAFSFTSKAVQIKNSIKVAVWTDGIVLISDNEDFCAYRLQKGKKYKVTIEEV
jgi:hypothetical protein